jgi:hypothetical protein
MELNSKYIGKRSKGKEIAVASLKILKNPLKSSFVFWFDEYLNIKKQAV